MKYAISILASNEYQKERYETFEEAEKVYLAIPEEDRDGFGIAEVHSKEEIAKLNKEIKEDV